MENEDLGKQIIAEYAASESYYQSKMNEIVNAWKRYEMVEMNPIFPGRSHTVSTLVFRSVELIYPRLRALFLSGGKLSIGAESHGDNSNNSLDDLIKAYMEQKVNVEIDAYEDVCAHIKQYLIAGTSLLQRRWDGATKKVVFDVIDIFDIYPQPRSYSMKRIKNGESWMIIREKTTVEEIRELIEDGIYEEADEDDIEQSGSASHTNDKREQVQAATNYPNVTDYRALYGEDDDGNVEVLHRWKGKVVSSCTSNGTLLRKEVKVKRFPFYLSRFYAAPFDFFGKGIGEVLRYIQDEATLIRNQRRDMETLNINGMWKYIDSAGSDIDFHALQNPRPGGTVRVGAMDDLAPIEPPGFAMIRQTFDDEATCHSEADGILQIGDIQRGTKEKPGITSTSSGMQMILQQQSVKINEGIEDLSKTFSDVMQDTFADYKEFNGSVEETVRVVGREGIKMETITVGEIEDEVKFTIKIDPSLGSNEMKAARGVQLLSQVAPYQNIINLRPLLVEILKWNDVENPQGMIVPSATPAPSLPPDLENQMLQAGALPDVHPDDNHEEHINTHRALGYIAEAHIMEHYDALVDGGVGGVAPGGQAPMAPQGPQMGQPGMQQGVPTMPSSEGMMQAQQGGMLGGGY